MLDENLPTFYFKPSSDNPLATTLFLSQNGSELQPEYSLRRPDPNIPASKNCYAVALYDSYNPEVLFAEVLVQPEWQQPTLSQAEIRAQNGIPPPPVPIVPEKFIVQLYNPDQQVTVKQIAGTWNSSAHWEFEMPQTSFRQPSVSAIDRTSNGPSLSDVTPKVSFKWKRDGKITKDISCYMSGKSTDGRKNKEPDILCAMLKGNDLTLYQPNMHRIEIEDVKGLEVVLLLGASVIKDIFFNPNREMFNISSPQTSAKPNRKNSGPQIAGKPLQNVTPPVMSGAGYAVTPSKSQLPTQPSRPQQQQQPQYQTAAVPRPSPGATNPLTQWEIDAETARLRKIVEDETREREKRDAREQKKIKKMLELEEKERQRREAEVAKETERLRRQYGMPPSPQGNPGSSNNNSVPKPPRMQFTAPPPPPPSMPPRPQNQGYQFGPPQHLPQAYSAPHSQHVPVQRPVSTPSAGGGNAGGSTFNLSSLNNLLHQGASTLTSHAHNSHGGSAGGSGRPHLSPYSQAPGNGTASSSGFFGLGGKKIQKKRSVFF